MLALQSDRLYDVFTRLDGCKVRALLTAAANASTKDKPPYRVLLVRKPIRIKVGDVLKSKGGELLLLLEHPTTLEWTKNFKVQHISGVYEWKRPIKTLDSVTKMPRDTGTSDMGMVYCTFDTPEDIKLDKMVETRYRFLTGQDVRTDDIIDGKIVRRVVDVLGVKLVFAE